MPLKSINNVKLDKFDHEMHLESIKNIKNRLLTENNIEIKLDLQDELKGIKKQIKILKKKEKDYFLNNSNYIFNYFEKKKELSEGHSKKKILHSFFDSNSNDITENKKVNESETEKYLNNIENTILDINKFKIKCLQI